MKKRDLVQNLKFKDKNSQVLQQNFEQIHREILNLDKQRADLIEEIVKSEKKSFEFERKRDIKRRDKESIKEA